VRTLRRWLALVSAAAALLIAAAAHAEPRATAEASFVRDCHVYAFYPSVLISSVRNISCHKARHEMRRYRKPIYRTFTTPGGYYCYRVSGRRYGGQWRCVKGNRAWRFEFSD
jgi:hypothetical protein